MSTFKIRATKRIVYKDQSGAEIKVYEIGDLIDATGATQTYWITAMGGIYFDEAEAV